MDALTNHELQLGILELDHAIYLHDQWFRNLLKVLIAHVPAERADLCVDAHLHCSFGRWLAGELACSMTGMSTLRCKRRMRWYIARLGSYCNCRRMAW